MSEIVVCKKCEEVTHTSHITPSGCRIRYTDVKGWELGCASLDEVEIKDAQEFISILRKLRKEG